MKAQAKNRLLQCRAEIMNRPRLRTDILGSLRAASEELSSVPETYRAALVIFSDFTQEDAQFDFKRDPRMGNAEHARALATRISNAMVNPLHGAPTYVGYLASRDLRSLDQERGKAIQEFWRSY